MVIRARRRRRNHHSDRRALTDYQLAFTWMFGIEALHLACAFDFRAGAPTR
jgi:hypothetical protein